MDKKKKRLIVLSPQAEFIVAVLQKNQDINVSNMISNLIIQRFGGCLAQKYLKHKIRENERTAIKIRKENIRLDKILNKIKKKSEI